MKKHLQWKWRHFLPFYIITNFKLSHTKSKIRKKKIRWQAKRDWLTVCRLFPEWVKMQSNKACSLLSSKSDSVFVYPHCDAISSTKSCNSPIYHFVFVLHYTFYLFSCFHDSMFQKVWETIGHTSNPEDWKCMVQSTPTEEVGITSGLDVTRIADSEKWCLKNF